MRVLSCLFIHNGSSIHVFIMKVAALIRPIRQDPSVYKQGPALSARLLEAV